MSLNHSRNQLVEQLCEDFLNRDDVREFVNREIKSYELDFDIDGPMTDAQEDLVSQFQVGIYHRIIAQMIVSM